MLNEHKNTKDTTQRFLLLWAHVPEEKNFLYLLLPSNNIHPAFTFQHQGETQQLIWEWLLGDALYTSPGLYKASFPHWPPRFHFLILRHLTSWIQKAEMRFKLRCNIFLATPFYSTRRCEAGIRTLHQEVSALLLPPTFS